MRKTISIVAIILFGICIFICTFVVINRSKKQERKAPESGETKVQAMKLDAARFQP